MILLLTTLAGGAASAETAAESGRFAVSFGGLRAGILAYEANETGGRYRMRGAARASGVVGALFDAEIDTVAEGRVSANTYRPDLAREVTRSGEETTERLFRFDGGVPQVTRRPEKAPPSHAAPAAQQVGTVDTTTAAYAILRDRPAELACRLDIAVFDGTRRHRIRLDAPKATDRGIACSGRYSRIAGFKPDEMAERQHWPLTLEYVRQPDGTLRVDNLSFPTSFGKARITRD